MFKQHRSGFNKLRLNIKTYRMNKTLIILAFLVSSGLFCNAQPQTNLSTPQLELIGNQIYISYDIINSTANDVFRVWIEVTDSTGNKIPAKSLRGDIGKNIGGGNNKKIVWNFEVDNVYLEGGLYVQVYAEKLTPVVSEEGIKPDKSISRGGIIFRSALFPGWGLSKIGKGKAHLLKGVIGYGSIAASVYYNKKAISSYDDYLNATDIQDETFYNNSVKEDNMSEIFAYTAIGIWVIDLVWTIAGSKELKKESNYSQIKGFSIQTIYDPRANAPLVAFRYKF